MQIFRIASITCLVLFLHLVIGHMVAQCDAVIVVMSKGLVRKPQPASNKPSTTVLLTEKIRRNSKSRAKKNRLKRKWIKSWISRVLRKSGGFRSKAGGEQHNTTHYRKRPNGRHYNKNRLKQ